MTVPTRSLLMIRNDYLQAVTDPGFPNEGTLTTKIGAPTYYFGKFFQKTA